MRSASFLKNYKISIREKFKERSKKRSPSQFQDCGTSRTSPPTSGISFLGLICRHEVRLWFGGGGVGKRDTLEDVPRVKV